MVGFQAASHLNFVKASLVNKRPRACAMRQPVRYTRAMLAIIPTGTSVNLHEAENGRRIDEK